MKRHDQQLQDVTAAGRGVAARPGATARPDATARPGATVRPDDTALDASVPEADVLAALDPDREGGTLDPVDWDALRQVAHRALDCVLDLQRSIREEPAWRPMPESVDARLRASAPLDPQPIEDVFEEYLEDILPFYTGNIHPRFWGWVPGQGTPGGLIGALLAAGSNVVAGQFNDAGSRVEQQVIDWTKEILGFPASASGILTSGGSVANLTGLAVGRDARAGYDVVRHGLDAAPARLVLYASTEVHSSVTKAAQLLGLGRDAVHLVPVDDQYRIRLDALADAIRCDREHGIRPFAIVGSVGTVNTGAIDDLEGLADLAAEQELWLHLDGAFGAIAGFSAQLRPLLRGIERADSLAFDFHKWTSIPYDVGCVLVRDSEAHRRSFTADAAYLEKLPRGTGAWRDQTDVRGLQLSRGFRALKVWFSLKEHGFRRFGESVDRNVAQARYLADLVEAAADLELLAPVPLCVVCFRFVSSTAAPGTDWNAVNREILMRLQERGIAVPSSTVLDGRFAIRVANTNHRSRRQDFDILTAASVEIGREVVAEGIGAPPPRLADFR